jgi:hypothetical protein
MPVARRSIKEADPPARQPPLPGVRRERHVGITRYDGGRRRIAPGGGGPAAGGAIGLASRTVRTARAVRLSPGRATGRACWPGGQSANYGTGRVAVRPAGRSGLEESRTTKQLAPGALRTPIELHGSDDCGDPVPTCWRIISAQTCPICLVVLLYGDSSARKFE